MNKSEIGDRLAGRLGLNKVVAKEAADGVFEGDRRGSGDWRGGPACRLRNLCGQESGGSYRAQPPDRRGAVDPGLKDTVIQGWQGTQGCGE